MLQSLRRHGRGISSDQTHKPSILLAVSFALLLGATLELSAESSDPVPKAISPAEQRAVQLILDYLETGGEAWWPALAADSPHRPWGQETFSEEIAVRLGPREGSHFTLQTPGTRHGQDLALVRIEFSSGLEDLAEMRFVEEAGAWKLRHLRVLGEPRPADQTIDDLIESSSLAPFRLPNGLSPAPGTSLHPSTLVGFSITLGLLFLLGRLPPRRRGHHRGLVLVSLVAAMAFACSEDSGDSDKAKSKQVETEVAPDTTLRLASLTPLREALVGGAELDIDQLGALIPKTAKGQVRQTARSWTAQILLASGRLGQTEKVLKNMPTPALRPLIELLRARLALLQSKSGDILAAYDRALIRAPDTDHLRLEAAYASLIMAREDQARIGFEMTMRAGSRMSEAWLVASQLAAVEDRLEEAERRFRLGFRLKPMTRESLFDDPLLSTVATRPAVFSMLGFSQTEEPILSPAQAPTRPLELPAKAQAVLLGERLDITLGESTLSVLGAADLIPPGTLEVSAADAEREQREKTLADLEDLTAALQRPGGLAHPARQREAQVAALALAKQRRWDELLDLTAVEDTPAMPANLVKLRGLALLKAGRDIEAKNLLIRLAQSDRVNRRKDPGTYYQLAEMFVRTGEYDLALRLIKKANSMSPQKVSPQRIRQIEMDRELDAGFETFESDHFLLRYPKATGEKYPQQLSWVLEAEWQRLRHWIPVDGKEKIEIHLFELDEFMRAFSGGVSVLGIYDGKVRVPLADLKSFHPLLVNIVSHEVAHAMVDQATDDQTPKWFNEGLASHVEMDQKSINPIPDMHKSGKYLSFAIMEPVLAGFSEPQLVELAYSHSTWALHFIEQRHGVRAIHRFLRAFKDGLDTEAALKKVLKQDMAQFDEAFKAWALNDAPNLWPTQLVRYERQFDALIERNARGLKKPVTESRNQPTRRAANQESKRRRFALPPSESEKAAEEAARNLERTQKAEAKKSPKPSVPRAGSKEAYQAWHAHYAAKTRPVKIALGETLAIFNGKKEGQLNPACRRLSRELETLQTDPKALTAPTKSLSRSLEKAYRHFERAANSCMRGHLQRMNDDLEEATKELGRANRELQRHGLKP